MGWIIGGAMIFIIIGFILYWQLIVTEGAYLGAPIVALLYDLTAERYNKIKDFDEYSEQFTLGTPLANRLSGQPQATVLDVATGTGRIPLRLLKQPGYKGRVIGVDRAAKMLVVAKRDTAGRRERVMLIQADAMALPFAANSLPVVTCLEALEFLPNPEKGLKELIRVLRPASAVYPDEGWLMTTRRIGWEAKLMPGKTWSREQLEAVFNRFSLRYIDIQVWQDIYDLVWAQKYKA